MTGKALCCSCLLSDLGLGGYALVNPVVICLQEGQNSSYSNAVCQGQNKE